MLHSISGTEIHFTLEALAYFIGAQVYWRSARDQPSPQGANRLLLLGCVLLGALLGSKLLHIAEHFPYLTEQNLPGLWLAGKSVLGGFLGGTLGAELGKKIIGWQLATGDAWVPAITVGLLIGRLGCQLSGTWDQTYGTPTDLPWAWNYGDGIGRHPTALYEIVLVLLAFMLSRSKWIREKPGASFAVFIGLYCVIRFGLEFLKPPFGQAAADGLPIALYGGMTAIQLTALIGLIGFSFLFFHRLNQRNTR